MRFPWTLSALVVAVMLLLVVKTNARTPANETPTSGISSTISDDLLKERLENIQLPFEARYSTKTKSYVKRYISNGYKDSQRMLGRASLYFPIFEHFLSLYQLPEELKFLPMVESTLLPKAKSPAGAAGLWQLVPITAKHMGLTINSHLDERLDPYKATEAAVKYLAFLYGEFQDWPLALAAYNCGPTRVKKALRYANCDNYWDIIPYLPAESRQYVPAYIAAAYLVNYYDDHGLQPRYLDNDLQDTRTFRVNNYISLREVAAVTGIEPSIIYRLNPGYLQGFVPRSRRGHFLIIPTTAAPTFRRHLAKKNEWKELLIPDGFFRSSYTVVAGDRMEALAMLFRCKAEDIMKWNNLSHPEVVVNQQLNIFLPDQNLRATP